MTDNRSDEHSRVGNFEIATPWSDVIRIVCMGHTIGLVSCGAALATSRANVLVFDWLEIAAALFALGIISSLFAFLSMRSAAHHDEMLQVLISQRIQNPSEIPRLQQLAAQRFVIAILLTLGSAVTFFCGCATALMALYRS
jgi:hypothetical protein